MTINNSFIILDKLITEIKSGNLRTSGKNIQYFDVYWIDDDDASVELSDEVYVGEPSEVDDGVDDDDYDNALLPSPVKERNWWLLFSGEAIEDVIDNVINQIGDTDNKTLLQAIKYYWERDFFFDFKQPENNVGSLG
ncbi:DUF7716 domain-containing protein [Vibrio fluvialis]|uniref:DUF7716 domain-containing protein n=1 Tax=Vibrio fluvialis TaxID=676 RepID=UPI003BA26B01